MSYCHNCGAKHASVEKAASVKTANDEALAALKHLEALKTDFAKFYDFIHELYQKAKKDELAGPLANIVYDLYKPAESIDNTLKNYLSDAESELAYHAEVIEKVKRYFTGYKIGIYWDASGNLNIMVEGDMSKFYDLALAEESSDENELRRPEFDRFVKSLHLKTYSPKKGVFLDNVDNEWVIFIYA